MRIQHVVQAVKGWPDNGNDERQQGARFADAVEHIRWRLWHGQVQRALDLIGDIMAALAAETSPVRATAGKVVKLLRDLETYVAGQAELIIDYAAARLDGSQYRRRRPKAPCNGCFIAEWALIGRCVGRREAHI